MILNGWAPCFRRVGAHFYDFVQAIGNRVRLSITGNRTEPASLFFALVAEPADAKSEVIDIVTSSFLAMQRSAEREPVSRVDDVVARLEQARKLRARMKLAAEGKSPISDVRHRTTGRGQLLLTEATVAGIRGRWPRRRWEAASSAANS